MTTRDPLDLRGKTMTELMALDMKVGRKLDTWNKGAIAESVLDQEYLVALLADRRQIREEMERRRNLTAAEADDECALIRKGESTQHS